MLDGLKNKNNGATRPMKSLMISTSVQIQYTSVTLDNWYSTALCIASCGQKRLKLLESPWCAEFGAKRSEVKVGGGWARQWVSVW